MTQPVQAVNEQQATDQASDLNSVRLPKFQTFQELECYRSIIFDFDGVIAAAGRKFAADFDYSEESVLGQPGIQHELLQHIAYAKLGLNFSLREVNEIYHNPKLYGGSYWDLIGVGLQDSMGLSGPQLASQVELFKLIYKRIAEDYGNGVEIQTEETFSTEQQSSVRILNQLQVKAFDSFKQFYAKWKELVPDGRAGIFTASPASYANAMIKRMGLTGHFDLIQGCDAIWHERGYDKSWPLPLLDLLYELDAKPESTLVIDDSLGLLKSARENRCHILFAGPDAKISEALQLKSGEAKVYVSLQPYDISVPVLSS